MVIRLALALLVLLALPLSAEVPLAPGEARLTVLHDHGNPVVAEMVHLKLRGEYDLTVSLEELVFPDSEAYDWMQIDRDRWFKERIGGRMIQIFERDIALFPRAPGELTIPPINHDLTNIRNDGVREEVRVTSAPTRLAVRPFPGRGRPLTARALVLTDELSAEPGRLTKDEVLTRRVTIEALGALAHHLPPRPDIRQPWLISFTQPEIRETVPTADGPVSRVVWEWQLRPRTGEPGVLPAAALEWFNTRDRQLEVAPLKPIPFGYAGFGSNFGDRQAEGPEVQLAMAGLFGLGLVIALVVGLQGRVPMMLRRMRRSPHLEALQSAARTGDLQQLRAAADRQAAWQGGPVGRQQALLRALDDRIFSSRQTSIDPQQWAADFISASRSGAT
ncbi:hypothetical protein [Paracoccus beibuensis]|uniref:hypothetical protein n=1 Tax=Paracoccus beibuensis TaxID=547602 RepID=UPI00223F954C|nr:hypothetical protein [Paracoccus beibuensis]